MFARRATDCRPEQKSKCNDTKRIYSIASIVFKRKIAKCLKCRWKTNTRSAQSHLHECNRIFYNVVTGKVIKWNLQFYYMRCDCTVKCFWMFWHLPFIANVNNTVQCIFFGECCITMYHVYSRRIGMLIASFRFVSIRFNFISFAVFFNPFESSSRKIEHAYQN